VSASGHATYAIRYAHREASRSQNFYEVVECADDPMPLDYFTWVIAVSEEALIAVDSGHTESEAVRRGRTYLQSPLETMAQIGSDPSKVGTVVVTHLHWDHTGNLSRFDNAEIILQRREWEFWTSAHANRGQFAGLHTPDDLKALERARQKGRLRLVDGDVEIADGVSAHLVGGHTPGMQVVRIAGEQHSTVLASDAAHFYENLEKDSPFAIVFCLSEMYDAFDRMVELAGSMDRVVPGHDPQVMSNFPACSESALAVRLNPT
jgi:glyoxylase-like metal-dependent hydrolase (beta-lactamase superfamily II)